MKNKYILSVILLVISFVIGLWVYPQMPERVASHWDASGQVNGYMSKFWGVFLMPIIQVVMLILLVVIPRLDPKKENIEKFKGYYINFINIISGFLLYIYILTLMWNMGYKFDMIRFMLPALSVLFWFAGILMEKAEPNWTIGIRTPWTLSSPTVWHKTHSLGARLFKYSSIISLVGLIFPTYAIWFLIVPIMVSALSSVVYSYLVYKTEK
jgi:uncharacterized membrane protein